jgi:hypothetical protein
MISAISTSQSGFPSGRQTRCRFYAHPATLGESLPSITPLFEFVAVIAAPVSPGKIVRELIGAIFSIL